MGLRNHASSKAAPVHLRRPARPGLYAPGRHVAELLKTGSIL